MEGHAPLVALVCGSSTLAALAATLYCAVMESRLSRRWDMDWVERARLARLLGYRLRLALALLLLSLPMFVFAVMGPL